MALCLREFLRSARAQWDQVGHAVQEGGTHPFHQIHVYFGNEACDLDSISSAVALAYAGARGRERKNSDVHVPLVSVPRSDARARTEALRALSWCGISLDDALCLDVPDHTILSHLSASGILGVHLVDHNALAPPLKHLQPHVVRIVDHHRDEGEMPHVCGAARRIAPVGSCATLVGEILINDGLLNTERADASLCRLIAATIALDTVAFDEDAQRTTALDREVFARAAACEVAARQRCGSESVPAAFRAIAEQGESPEALLHLLHQELEAAKFDQGHLTASELLARDAKSFAVRGTRKTLAIAAFSVPLADFAAKSDSQAALDTFALSREADAVILMTFIRSENGGLRRELGVAIPTEPHADGKLHSISTQPGLKVPLPQAVHHVITSLASELALNSLPALSEKDKPAGHSDHARCYRIAMYSQGNVAISRKRLVPLLLPKLELMYNAEA